MSVHRCRRPLYLPNSKMHPGDLEKHANKQRNLIIIPSIHVIRKGAFSLSVTVCDHGIGLERGIPQHLAVMGVGRCCIQLRRQQVDERLFHSTQATNRRNMHENERHRHMKIALPFVPPQAQFTTHCFPRTDLLVLAPSGSLTGPEPLRGRLNIQKTLQLRLQKNATMDDRRSRNIAKCN